MPPTIRESSHTADQDRLPVIRLHRFDHRGKAQIGLRFPYDVVVKGHLLRLSFVRWSRTHGCFYIRDEKRILEQLAEHCRGKIWLRLADLGSRHGARHEVKSSKGGSGRKEKRSRVKLQSVVQDKIELFAGWLRQKRLSAIYSKDVSKFCTSILCSSPRGKLGRDHP